MTGGSSSVASQSVACTISRRNCTPERMMINPVKVVGDPPLRTSGPSARPPYSTLDSDPKTMAPTHAQGLPLPLASLEESSPMILDNALPTRVCNGGNGRMATGTCVSHTPRPPETPAGGREHREHGRYGCNYLMTACMQVVRTWPDSPHLSPTGHKHLRRRHWGRMRSPRA